MNRLWISGAGLFLACFAVCSRAAAEDNQKDPSTGLRALDDVATRITIRDDVAKLSKANRDQLLADVDNAFSLVQTEQITIARTNVNDVLTCLKGLASHDLGNRNSQDVTSQRIVLYCLSTGQGLDVDVVYRLVGQLRFGASGNINEDGKKVVGKEWQDFRNKIVKLRL